MRITNLTLAILIGAVAGTVCSATAVPAAEPDWKAVEQALGKPGQLQDGDVFRVGMPRADLAVTVKGVPVKAASPPAPSRPSNRSATKRRARAVPVLPVRRVPP